MVHPDGPLAACTVNTRTSPTKHHKAEGPCLQDKFNKQLVKALEKPGGVKGWGVEGGGEESGGVGRARGGEGRERGKLATTLHLKLSYLRGAHAPHINTQATARLLPPPKL